MSEGTINTTRIKVIGVGGGGNNAVNRMIATGLDHVEYWSIDTTFKRPNTHPTKNILKIGNDTTNGLGAGSNPSIGRNAANESIEDINKLVLDTDMVFVTCGMGGGTGTGSAPIVAKAAKEAGVLTIAIVTKPFRFEGAVRMRNAEEGIEELKKVVDAFIVISNDKLMDIIEIKTSMKDAFKIADEVLYQSIYGISSLITKIGLINTDFADIKTILKDMGSAFIGIGKASGENRVIEAVDKALASPLLEESFIGAEKILFNIAGSDKLTLAEITKASDIIVQTANPNAHIIWGTIIDESLKDEIVVTIVSAGFKLIDKKIKSTAFFDAKKSDDNNIEELFPFFAMNRKEREFANK